MPNWVINKITISGKNVKERIEPLLTLYTGNDKPQFDFEKLIPCPKELTETEESTRTPDSVYANNIKKYGFKSWYDWRCHNWGCKWNACDTEIFELTDTYADIEFQTPWNAMGFTLFTLICFKFSDCEITLEYADEDCGSNTGWYSYDSINKEPTEFRNVNCSKEAYETYIKCWGQPEELVYNEKINNYEWVYED